MKNRSFFSVRWTISDIGSISSKNENQKQPGRKFSTVEVLKTSAHI